MEKDSIDLGSLLTGASIVAFLGFLFTVVKWVFQIRHTKKTHEMEEKIGELNITKISNQVMKETLETLQKGLDDARDEVEDIKEKLGGEINLLNAKLDASQQIINDLREQIKTQEAEKKQDYEYWTEELKEKDNIITSLRDQISKNNSSN